MRKIHLLGVALVALCAFTAFSSSSAFALEFTLAQWLANGARITSALASDALGTILLENLEVGADILCSGLFAGTVGPESADTVTKLFNLAGTTEIPELDESGATGGILCTGDSVCAESDPEVWPVKLPWRTELELDKTSPPELFYILFFGAAYFILCLVLGIDVTELCVAEEGSGPEALNVTGGVEAMGEPINAAGEPAEANCSGNNVGMISFLEGNLTTLTNGETLTVSE